MTYTEDFRRDVERMESKYGKAVSALADMDNYAIQLSAIVECEIDFLSTMNAEKIDCEYHEKLYALSEILSRIVKDMRKTLDNSPVA